MGFLLSAQKIGAQTPPSSGVYPVVPYGVQPLPPDPFKFSLYQIVLPIAGLIIVLSGVISPIIGYLWYIKHGGTKKWLKWLACLPLAVAIIALVIFLVWPK